MSVLFPEIRLIILGIRGNIAENKRRSEKSMTKYETDQIFKSRLQNEDYKTIAKRMSIKAKTIASYCYRNGLTDSNIDSISECCYCHEKIEQKAKGKKRLFCNDKCRSAWRRAHHMLIEPVYHHVCAGCGTAFKTAGNKSQKYCSRQCYLNHRKGSAV